MIVFPAVDILGGHCVQLVQGRRESATVFGTPAECADRWIRQGAEALHVINLDGAFGDSTRNATLIRDLVKDTGISIQLGGGIRTHDDAVHWLETGIDRVILGTLARNDPGSLSRLAEEFGRERIMAGVDARGGQIAIEGWQVSSGDFIEWARVFSRKGAGSLLFTNVDVEGLQGGIDPGPVRDLISAVKIPIIVAGGISSPGDVSTLKSVGAWGIVLGSALYSGLLRLPDAMEAAR